MKNSIALLSYADLDFWFCFSGFSLGFGQQLTELSPGLISACTTAPQLANSPLCKPRGGSHFLLRNTEVFKRFDNCDDFIHGANISTLI